MKILKDSNTVSQDTLKNPYPSELTALKQWLVWRLEDNGKPKPDKVPYQALTPHVMASTTDPNQWSTYEDAAAALQNTVTNPLSGIGFVFTKDDPYIGIDLDECRDPDTGVLSERAKEIVKQLNSYTEVSQSGTGLHIFIKGTLPPSGRKKDHIEMYEYGRFFTMTGNRLKGTLS